MALSKPIPAPNGVTMHYHRAVRAEVLADGIVVHLQSWLDEQSCLDGNPPLWTFYENLPLGDLLEALEAQVVVQSEAFLGADSLDGSALPLARARALRWAEIKAQRQLKDHAPMALRDFEVDADAGSRMDLMGAVMAMQITGQATRLWRCTDNVMRELKVQDLVTVGTAVAARRQALIETSDVLYQQIQAAETVEAVRAVVWPDQPQE